MRQNKGKKPNKKSRSLSYKTPNTEIRSQKSIKKWSTVQPKTQTQKSGDHTRSTAEDLTCPENQHSSWLTPTNSGKQVLLPVTICWISRVAENVSAGGGTLNGLSPRSTLIYKQIWPGYECPGGLPRGSVIGWYRISTVGRFQLSHNEFSKSAPHPEHRTINATNLCLA